MNEDGDPKETEVEQEASKSSEEDQDRLFPLNKQDIGCSIALIIFVGIAWGIYRLLDAFTK